MKRLALVAAFAVAAFAGAVSAQTPADTLALPRRGPLPDSLRAVVSPRDSARAAQAFAVRAAPPGVERRRPLPQRSLLAGNVVAGTGLTAARALAEGVPARRLPGVALGGAVAGAGFYAAKRLVGRRQTVAGFALAYASASLAENVAEGRHALSHVRVGLGPLDLRVATGLGRDTGGPGVRVEADALSVGAAVVLPLGGYRLRPCRAGLCYRSETSLPFVRGGRRYRRVGRTVGRVVRVWQPFTTRTEAHEGVHVIQGMQLVAATPRGTVREITGWRSGAAVALDARVDWLSPLAGALVFPFVPYERVWTEREAFTLAGPDSAPLP